MSAVLKIDALAVMRPTYVNTNIRLFFLWSRDNDASLRAYYADLGRSLPDDADNGLEGFAKAQRFLCFCQVQWDRQRMAL